MFEDMIKEEAGAIILDGVRAYMASVINANL